MKKTVKSFRRKIKSSRPCFFCQEKSEPDYKEPEILRRYLSERGKILSATQTGVCHKHQRKLSQEIKRARFLALLPFIVRPS